MRMLEELTSAIKELSSMAAKRSPKKQQEKSCTPCWNGTSCKYLARGCCLFSHSHLDKPVSAVADLPESVADLTRRIEESNSKLKAQVAELGRMNSVVETLASKLRQHNADAKASEEKLDHVIKHTHRLEAEVRKLEVGSNGPSHHDLSEQMDRKINAKLDTFLKDLVTPLFEAGIKRFGECVEREVQELEERLDEAIAGRKSSSEVAE